jgi:hypothetical protein
MQPSFCSGEKKFQTMTKNALISNAFLMALRVVILAT